MNINKLLKPIYMTLNLSATENIEKLLLLLIMYESSDNICRCF